MRRFYSPKENFSNGVAVLDLDETRHLRDVLRLHAGEEVRVFDGEASEYLCRIRSIEKKKTVLDVLKPITPEAPESPLDLTLAAAVTKGEKFDLVVQKAVELGVSRLVPMFTRRCDVNPGGSEKRLERWRKIALEACKQSGRAKLMSVDPAVDFTKFLDKMETKDTAVLFSEREGGSFEDLPSRDRITAFIGPEGGWDDAELEMSRQHGVQIVTLGGRILRAETAAIICLALLQHRFGDLK